METGIKIKSLFGLTLKSNLTLEIELNILLQLKSGYNKTSEKPALELHNLDI